MGDITGDTSGIEKITIATTGNASDFGDLTEDKNQGDAISNAHGGLS
jgi:hypothetical protein